MLWIPAFAGMAGWWIPAFAGMTKSVAEVTKSVAGITKRSAEIKRRCLTDARHNRIYGYSIVTLFSTGSQLTLAPRFSLTNLRGTNALSFIIFGGISSLTFFPET